MLLGVRQKSILVHQQSRLLKSTGVYITAKNITPRTTFLVNDLGQPVRVTNFSERTYTGTQHYQTNTWYENVLIPTTTQLYNTDSFDELESSSLYYSQPTHIYWSLPSQIELYDSHMKPIVFDEYLGYMIGLFLACGIIHDDINCVLFPLDTYEQVSIVCAVLMKSDLGRTIPFKLIRRDLKTICKIYLESEDIVRFFKQFLTAGQKLGLPERFMTSNISFVKGFRTGYMFGCNTHRTTTSQMIEAMLFASHILHVPSSETVGLIVSSAVGSAAVGDATVGSAAVTVGSGKQTLHIGCIKDSYCTIEEQLGLQIEIDDEHGSAIVCNNMLIQYTIASK